MLATGHNNLACVRLRALSLMLAACNKYVNTHEVGRRLHEGQASPGKAHEEAMEVLRTWRRGWSWRRQRERESGTGRRFSWGGTYATILGDDGGGGADGKQAEDGSSGLGAGVWKTGSGVQGSCEGPSEESSSSDGLSEESESSGLYGGANGGEDGREVSGLDQEFDDEECLYEAGRAVPVITQRELWVVREAQRAAESCEEAMNLFTQARCVVESAVATKNRELASSLVQDVETQMENGAGEEVGEGEDECQWMPQVLPLPHIMACFDRRHHLPWYDVGPVLVEREGGAGPAGTGWVNHSVSWEQEMLLRRGKLPRGSGDDGEAGTELGRCAYRHYRI